MNQTGGVVSVRNILKLQIAVINSNNYDKEYSCLEPWFVALNTKWQTEGTRRNKRILEQQGTIMFPKLSSWSFFPPLKAMQRLVAERFHNRHKTELKLKGVPVISPSFKLQNHSSRQVLHEASWDHAVCSVDWGMLGVVTLYPRITGTKRTSIGHKSPSLQRASLFMSPVTTLVPSAKECKYLQART